MAETPTPSKDNWSNAISHDDHGSLVSITTCLMLVAMLLSLGIRMATRWPWSQLIGLDDMTTIVASVFAVGQSVATFEAVHSGLGRRQDELDSNRPAGMEKAIYAGDILFILALAGAKLAVSLLLLRLSRSKHVLTTRIVAILIVVWGFAAVLAVAIRPNSTQPWDLTPEEAHRHTHTFIGIGAVSILLEIALLVSPVVLVWGLQMSLASKLAIIAGFAFRIPISVIIILRLVSFHHALDQTTDISWSYIEPSIYNEIEMHYSLIAATIPCMRIFLSNFSTGYLGTTAEQVDPTATGAATKGSSSYAMSSTRARRLGAGSKKRSEKHGQQELRSGDDDAITTDGVTHAHNARETDSITSDKSDRAIIRKTVHIDWDYGGK